MTILSALIQTYVEWHRLRGTELAPRAGANRKSRAR